MENRCYLFRVNQRLISEIGKSQRLRVVNRLKRSQGMSVGELAEALEMSYMGVKQHCIELERLGYLDTWRKPKPATKVGRPEMVYRLTRKASDLFPSTSNATTLGLLDAAQTLYGTAAPEKLLYLLFQKKTQDYQAQIRGETLQERAEAFAALREAEGCMTEVEKEGSSVRIIEHHSPVADLLAAYPDLLCRLEQEMFSTVLGSPVRRIPMEVSGLYYCVFQAG